MDKQPITILNDLITIFTEALRIHLLAFLIIIIILVLGFAFSTLVYCFGLAAACRKLKPNQHIKWFVYILIGTVIYLGLLGILVYFFGVPFCNIAYKIYFCIKVLHFLRKWK
jgi:heme A synthase